MAFPKHSDAEAAVSAPALPRMRGRRLALSLAGLGLMLAAALPAASAATAPMPAGGVLCLDMGMASGDGFKHLMLTMAAVPGSAAVTAVNAIQHGRETGIDYANQFAGTATVAPSNDAGSERPTLYIGLTGNGMGINADGTSELWLFSYSLALDPATFAGRIYGSESQSQPLANGAAFEVKQTWSVLAEVRPMDCAGY